ncbi:MAG: PHB depolymerase family esterase [Burkholderiaceae bacterium]
MNTDFQSLMAHANRLTQSGDLMAATAAIQQALGATPAVSARTTPVDEPIDGTDLVIVVDGPSESPASGGRTVSGQHASAHGSRDYRLYIPPQAGSAPLPLVMMLHGCTQTADDFAAGTGMSQAAFERGFYVLYPEQSAQANPQRCWNWFKHSHQERERGEPALLTEMLRKVMSDHAVDPARIYVAGLSAGGAMAAILADTHPELFAAVGVHSGLAAGAARDLPGALNAMRQGGAGNTGSGRGSVPTIVFHGDADATVHPSNGEHVIAAAAAQGGASSSEHVQRRGRRASTQRVHRADDGRVLAEHWLVHGSAHAWSGGTRAGSYTDPSGPDASAEMLRFFFEHGRRH